MRNQGMVILAVFIILVGVLLLIGNILNINFWAFCFPVGLILLGLFLILRPRMVGPDTRSEVILIGELDRSGQWDVGKEEYISFVADIDYDLTKANIPEGETTIRGFGFVGDISIFAPEDVGIALDISSFVTEFKVDDGEDETNILAPLHWRSDNYKLAERRIRFVLTQFVGDIKLKRF